MKYDLYWGNSRGVIEVAKQVTKDILFQEARHFIREYNLRSNPSWRFFEENPTVMDYGDWTYFFYIFGGNIIDEL